MSFSIILIIIVALLWVLPAREAEAVTETFAKSDEPVVLPSKFNVAYGPLPRNKRAYGESDVARDYVFDVMRPFLQQNSIDNPNPVEYIPSRSIYTGHMIEALGNLWGTNAATATENVNNMLSSAF